jgi:hypothetical protein
LKDSAMKQQTKHKLKCLLGASAEKVLPQIAREIDSGASTGKHLRVKNWIVYNRLSRAQANGDTASMSTAHFDYWKNDSGNAFYDQYTFRYQEWFLKHHHVLVDKTAEVCAEAGDYRRFVEIGCGDGRVTQYSREKIAGLNEVVGLDINPTIITRNAANPALDSNIRRERLFSATGASWSTSPKNRWWIFWAQLPGRALRSSVSLSPWPRTTIWSVRRSHTPSARRIRSLIIIDTYLKRRACAFSLRRKCSSVGCDG